MNERLFAEIGRMAEYPVGSKLYGTDTPESDEDFSGVFVAPKPYYLGLNKVEEVDFSIVDKKDNGRNSKDAIDRKFYELRKFVKLALENNPNIIEQLFVPAEKFVFIDPIAERLFSNAELFPHQGAKQKFMGYALSQKKKMLVKRDNMNALTIAQEILGGIVKEGFGKDYFAEQLAGIVGRLENAGLKVKQNTQHVQIGDIHIQKNITIAKSLEQISGRVERFSGRHADFVSKFGYDTKFASHLIRLLMEGRELLTTGRIQFPLEYASELLAIKQGHMTVNEVIELADDLEQKMNDDFDMGRVVVSKKPRTKEVETLLMDLVVEAWAVFYDDRTWR